MNAGDGNSASNQNCCKIQYAGEKLDCWQKQADNFILQACTVYLYTCKLIWLNSQLFVKQPVKEDLKSNHFRKVAAL